jgi:hypothetical protein
VLVSLATDGLRPVLRLDFFFVVGFALGGASGESFTRLWSRCRVFGYREPSWRRCWVASYLVLIFQVKTFLRVSEERQRRLQRRFLLEGVVLEIMTCFTCGGFAWRTLEELEPDGEEDRSLVLVFFLFFFLGVRFRV